MQEELSITPLFLSFRGDGSCPKLCRVWEVSVRKVGEFLLLRLNEFLHIPLRKANFSLKGSREKNSLT